MSKPDRTRAMVLGAVVGLALLPLVGNTAAVAQGAGSPPTVNRAAVAPPVTPRYAYPHELMTYRERFDMWRRMRAAQSPDERFELWASQHAELEKRAAEQGVILRDHGPMMGSGMMGSGHPDGMQGRPYGSGGGMMRHPMAW